jgi:hypothetical protein
VPCETKSQLIARLEKVDTGLDSARKSESYGLGSRNKPVNIKALQHERKEIMHKLDKMDGVFLNKAQFRSPLEGAGLSRGKYAQKA